MEDYKQVDIDYFLSRAVQEDEASRNAENPLAATVHRCLASRYRAVADGVLHLPSLNIARD